MKTRLFVILSLFVALSLTFSCHKAPSLDNILVSVSSKDVAPGDQVKCTFSSGHGPLKSDMVCLKSTTGGQDFEFAITELSDTYFTFTIGENFATDTYEFCIRRGSETKVIKTVTYTFYKNRDLQPSSGATIYGVVSCNGSGLKGVRVSDGYSIVETDADGVYNISSKKENGYVFITIPSGYEVKLSTFVPQFYQFTTASSSTAERHDFEVFEAGDQTNHTMLLLGDMHLAGGKQNDLTQFGKFTSEISSYVSSHSSEKVYAITLGDMIWDAYWYDKNYCFDQYITTMSTVKNLPIFHTIGNHDYDMKTSVDGSTAGWWAVDFDTATKYRKSLGPTYYSMDIGKVHYIVLDNIFTKNTTGGTSDDRHYAEMVYTDNLNWLKKDLSYVSKSTPIVVTMHAALYNQSGGNSLENATELINCFSGFSEVRVITGHTHKMWTVDSSNIHEHNSGAVCAAWWWAGYYYPELNLAQDGAPAGYRIMDVKGTSLSSYFKGTQRDKTYQFRTYDRNCISITETPYASTYGGYDAVKSDNEVLINVWDYNKNWKVEVTENGKALSVTNSTLYDPLYILTYYAKRYTSTVSSQFAAPFKTNHMFSVKASSADSTLEIKVTDDEGNVYTETMKRPKAFTTDTYK